MYNPAAKIPSMPQGSTESGSLKGTPSLRVFQGSSATSNPEWWVAPVKNVALAVFVAVPVFALFFPSLAGRVVWTILIAALPLFIVLAGYHRWRRICPLAFIAQIPARLKHPGRRRSSAWLEEHYYYVACAVFFVSLWLRLIATNGNGKAIAVFFVLLSLTAFAFGLSYTGKTWCNFACPLCFIEKLYTEPHGLQDEKTCRVRTQCVPWRL